MWIDKKLLPLKLLIFFLYAGFGCLMPFLTLHMYHLGLSHEEVTWINTVLPLTVLVGPPIAGYLADKFGHYRLITIVAMLLAGLFHTALLFVPERAPTFAPNMQLICGPYGSTFVLNTCFDSCANLSPGAYSKFRLSSCREECDFTESSCSALHRNQSEVKIVESEISIASPSKICFNNKSLSECHEFEYNTFMDMGATLGWSLGNSAYFEKYDKCCEVSLQEFSIGQEAKWENVTCSSNSNCHTICDVIEKPINDIYIIQPPTCTTDGSNPQSTFYIYFFVRALADMFPAILIALLDAVILTMVSQHGGDYGRQKMMGLFSIGLSAPILGYLMDMKALTHGKYIYAPVFYVFDILMIITAVITFTLPFNVEVRRSSMMKNFAKLLRNWELNCLYIIVILLGAFWGFLETFLYIYLLQDLSASNLLLGLTITVGLIPAVPFLYNSEAIVKLCGHHYLLMLAFVGYCIRFTGMAYMKHPYWVLPAEVLEIFTLHLMQVSAATLTYKLAPKELLATAQGLVWLAHFDVGRSLGTISGGYMIHEGGTIFSFKVCSVLSAIFAALYLLIHQSMKYYNSRQKIESQQREKKQIEQVNGIYARVPQVEDKF